MLTIYKKKTKYHNSQYHKHGNRNSTYTIFTKTKQKAYNLTLKYKNEKKEHTNKMVEAQTSRINLKFRKIKRLSFSMIFVSIAGMITSTTSR